jgi:hypothetical protein
MVGLSARVCFVGGVLRLKREITFVLLYNALPVNSLLREIAV